MIIFGPKRTDYASILKQLIWQRSCLACFMFASLLDAAYRKLPPFIGFIFFVGLVIEVKEVIAERKLLLSLKEKKP